MSYIETLIQNNNIDGLNREKEAIEKIIEITNLELKSLNNNGFLNKERRKKLEKILTENEALIKQINIGKNRILIVIDGSC